MLFRFKYKHYDYNNLTSGQVKKLLKAMGYKTCMQKKLISKAIGAYRDGRPHCAVSNIPHITVIPGSQTITKPVAECVNLITVKIGDAVELVKAEGWGMKHA